MGFWASIVMIELPLVPLVVDLCRDAAPSPIYVLALHLVMRNSISWSSFACVVSWFL